MEDKGSLDMLVIKTTQIAGFRKKSHKQDQFVHIAFKDLKSFMMGTLQFLVQVIEKGKSIFSETIRSSRYGIKDIVYFRPLNCYLISMSQAIYRKDIDGKHPYRYMNIDCGSKDGACFAVSQGHKKLLVNKDWRQILVVDPRKKHIEMLLEKKYIGYIYDFRILQKAEDQVAAVTEDGYVLLYTLNISKRLVLSRSDVLLDLIAEREEICKKVAACPKGDYLLVELTRNRSSPYCSRVALIQVVRNTLVLKLVINYWNRGMPEKMALNCYGYFEGKAIFVGLISGSEGVVQLYELDPEEERLKELKEKRVPHHELNPLRLHKLKGSFYYMGSFMKLMRLDINLDD